MIFWLGIILAFVAAACMAKKGLYEAWTLLLNTAIAVYLGITMAPAIKDLLGVGSPAGYIFTIFGTAVICLAILYFISYIIFLSQFNVTFPKPIDLAGGGLLGFLAVLLIWSFLAFLISVSPLSNNKLFKTLGFSQTAVQKNTGYMESWTHLVHSAVSTDQSQEYIEQTVTSLFDSVRDEPKAIVEPNEPPKPKDTEIEKRPEPVDPGPPPEIDF